MNIPNLKERLSTRFVAVVPKPTFKCQRSVVVQELDEGVQVVSDRLENKTFDRREEMKPYRNSDFSLHNLIAIGAPLESVKMRSSNLAMADELAHTLESIPVESFSESVNP